MRRIMKVAMLLALSLVIVAGAVLAGCSKGQAELQMPTIELSQYLKGTTGDLDDATLNAMADPGGEAGWKFGTMKAIYPTLFNANKDAVVQLLVAAAVFGSPYKFGDGVSPTTYAQLTAGDLMTVDGTIFATKLSAAEQDVVSMVIAGFFNTVETDMAAAKAPAETSAYAILQGVSATAAAGWLTDISLGKDAADAFFTWLVKEAVLWDPTLFGLPSGYAASDAECAAIGKASFTNGTASTMYPTQSGDTASAMYPTLRDSKSSAMYAKAYADLTAAEKLAVDAAVLGALDQAQKAAVDYAVYAALSSVFANDAARTYARDLTAVYFESQGWITAGHNTYALCTGVEKAQVDQGVYGSLGATALERDYIDFAAVPGAILSWVSEMAPALPYTRNLAYLTLKSNVDTTSAEGWKKDVTAEVNPRQAFYRWLAKEGVSAMAAAGPLIQVSVQEFYFKVTNPNDYDISLDSLSMNFQVKASTTSEEVDAAKQAMGDAIWVPAKEGDKDGEIIVRVLAPVQTVAVITWAIMAGKASIEAQALAGNVWGQIQAGTATWDVTVEATVSNKTDTQTKTYTLQWPLS